MANPEIKALLFDFGNTLAFIDYDALAAEFRQVCAGLEPLELERAEYIGREALDSYQMSTAQPNLERAYELYFHAWMQAAGIPPLRMRWCRERFGALNQIESLWRVVRPGTFEVLEEFRKAGFKLGVVSNAFGNIEADAKRYGLADFFDVIVDSHVVGVAKPDPRIFHIALQRLGVMPEETLFAGDLYSVDMLGAKAAGMRGKLIDVMGHYSWVDHVKIRGIHELPHP